MKSKIEEHIKERGYKMIDEQPPFRIYEKHHKRIIYHVSSCSIWGEFRFVNFEVIRNDEEDKNNCLHKEMKALYEYYLEMGCDKKEAIRYAKWNYQNLVRRRSEK